MAWGAIGDSNFIGVQDSHFDVMPRTTAFIRYKEGHTQSSDKIPEHVQQKLEMRMEHLKARAKSTSSGKQSTRVGSALREGDKAALRLTAGSINTSHVS